MFFELKSAHETRIFQAGQKKSFSTQSAVQQIFNVKPRGAALLASGLSAG